jgi:8-oxo-dGTP diphosphatase
MFFEGYMKNFVLEPIPKTRALLFALMSINGSLDILFNRTSEDFMDLEAIEDKINNLRQLRGMIQTELSVIHNELDYNRRQHYTSVLEHLINEFNLDGMITRISKKFDVIYDSMQLLYQKQNDENQEKAEKSMNLLNILFSLGIIADFVGLLLGAFNGFSEIPTIAYIVNGVSALLILSMFIYTMISRSKLKTQTKKKIIKRAADAVILDNNGNVVLIKRRYPPFRGQLALPGGIVEENETPRKTIIREVKEETNLDVKIEKEIGIYDAKGRDPRGPVTSTAFLCSITGDVSQLKLKGGDDAIDANFIPIGELTEIDLAFDHEEILQAGLKIAKSIGKFR